MRRIFAIFLICLLPFQLSQATAASLHGHLDEIEVAIGFHVHDDEGHHESHALPAELLVDGDLRADHVDGDGHHDDGHFHHVFSMLVFELPQNPLARQAPSLLPRLSAAFTSHIPLIIDRPPTARL